MPRYAKLQDNELGRMTMTLENGAFLSLCLAFVFATFNIWVPYRKGRRPLAIYDLGSAMAVLATLSAMSAGFGGWPLWAGGGGVLAGAAAYLAVNGLVIDNLSELSELFLAFFYAASFTFYAVSTIVGTTFARTLLGV